MIPAVYHVCGGLDVHKKSISATILKARDGEEPISVYQEFSAFTSGLYRLADWLKENNCETVAMESAGIYWVPVHHVLREAALKPYLVNPHHVKAIPGKKTDQADSHRIAHLFQHGLVRHSFVPEDMIQKLRLLTRSRARMLRMIQSFKNNTTRILDEANIKIGAVATDPFGVSATLIMNAMIRQPNTPPLSLAKLARGRLRKKEKELEEALNGFLNPTHIYLLQFNLQMLSILKARVKELEERAVDMCNEQPLRRAFAILKSFPGMKDVSAATILAEIGNDMSVFPSAENLASWAALCPGNNTSAGKTYSGKIRKGNAHLRRILVQVAWAAQRKQSSTLSSCFYRVARRRGAKRAIVALAHKILRIIYACISNDEFYQDEKVNGTSRVGHRRVASSAVPQKSGDLLMEDVPPQWLAEDKDETLMKQVDQILTTFSRTPLAEIVNEGVPETEDSGNWEIYHPGRKKDCHKPQKLSPVEPKDKSSSPKSRKGKTKERTG